MSHKRSYRRCRPRSQRVIRLASVAILAAASGSWLSGCEKSLAGPVWHSPDLSAKQGSGMIASLSDRVRVPNHHTPEYAPDVSHRPSFAPIGDRNDFHMELAIQPVVQEDAGYWCWAACAQMVHAFHGRHYTQAELAARIHGTDETGKERVQAAAYREIMLALNPELSDQIMQSHQAQFTSASPTTLRIDGSSYIASVLNSMSINSDDVVDALLNQSPVIVVLDEGPHAELQHAYVMRGIGFAVERRSGLSEAVNGASGWIKEFGFTPPSVVGEFVDASKTFDESRPWKYSIRWVDLIDPADGQITRLRGETFKQRVRLMIDQQRAQEILEQEFGIIKTQPASSPSRHWSARK